MTSKLKTDVLETVSGSGTIALTNQLTGMTHASMPSGSVLQVVQGTCEADTGTSSTSWQATTLFATITPSSTSSKILVTCHTTMYMPDNGTGAITVFRDSTEVTGEPNGLRRGWVNGTRGVFTISGEVLDSPSSTSTITYKIYLKSLDASYSVNVPDGGQSEYSSITLMEIAG